MFLNFNLRQYKDKIFPSPTESAVEPAENKNYKYSVDITGLSGLADFVAAVKTAVGEEASQDCINNHIHSDFIFDNSDWGSYYPRFEIVLSDNGVRLQPYDFRSAELPGIERRHRIERNIAENVRLETELKGIRKALFYLLDKYGEREAEAVQDFLKNDEYIRAQIARSPKGDKK